MTIQSNIVAADEDDIVALGEATHPVDRWSGVEPRGIDTDKVIMLHCLQRTGREC